VGDFRRQAHVALGPGADHGAVLEQEEEAEDGHCHEEPERGEFLDPAGDALDQRLEGVAGARADVVVGSLGLAVADSEILDPALDLVGAVLQLVADRGGLCADPPEDQIAGEDAGADDQQQNQDGTESARYPVALQQGDELTRDGRNHPRSAG
jgi:hypothetical protein